MYSQRPSDVVTHEVSQTCSYTRWAPKEVLCDRNYMEVGYLHCQVYFNPYALQTLQLALSCLLGVKLLDES